MNEVNDKWIWDIKITSSKYLDLMCHKYRPYIQVICYNLIQV